MHATSIHGLVKPLHPEILISVGDQGRIHVRNDSHSPTGLIGLALAVTVCEDLWRCHRFIATAKGTGTGKIRFGERDVLLRSLCSFSGYDDPAIDERIF